MAQLVCDQVTLVNTMTGSRLDRDGVKARFDVHPEQIVDYLALVGDTSDNIPGIPKVGPKTAAKWLNQYGTLDEIVAHAAEIPGKVGESLREHLGRLDLSRRLATIRCDVGLEQAPDDLTRRAPDTDKLRALYARLELSSLLRQLSAPADESGSPAAGTASRAASPAAPDRQREYECIVDEAALDGWLARLAAAELFAFDTETTSLDYMAAEIVGVSFCIEPGKAAYVPPA